MNASACLLALSLLLLPSVSRLYSSEAPARPMTMAIDEGHFNVHTAEGSYRPFAELARQAGLSVLKHTGPFTPVALSDYDVLVIALARGAGSGSPLEARGRPAFAPAEINAIEHWVDRGGALLLVSDHWPTGGAIAGLAETFGIDVTNGSTHDPLLLNDSIDTIVFDRDAGSMGNHPILCGRTAAERVDRVATYTGSSLRGPDGSSPLLLFSSKAFDAVGPEKKKQSASGRCQGLALGFGMGKVVVLAEAAMLRILDDPFVQNRQFANNLIAWLTGSLTQETAYRCN